MASCLAHSPNQDPITRKYGHSLQMIQWMVFLQKFLQDRKRNTRGAVVFMVEIFFYKRDWTKPQRTTCHFHCPIPIDFAWYLTRGRDPVNIFRAFCGMWIQKPSRDNHRFTMNKKHKFQLKKKLSKGRRKAPTANTGQIVSKCWLPPPA